MRFKRFVSAPSILDHPGCAQRLHHLQLTYCMYAEMAKTTISVFIDFKRISPVCAQVHACVNIHSHFDQEH